MAANLTEIRKVWRARLLGDVTVTGLLGGPKVYARDRRASPDVPSITLFDSFAHPSDHLPAFTGTLQADVWHTDRDSAAEIADRVVKLLDLKEIEDAALPPLLFDGIANMILHSVAFQVEQWSNEIVQKTVGFRFRGFQLT